MPDAAPIMVQVLGPLTVTRAEPSGTAILVTQPRHRALLAYLLLARPRGLHARDTVLALLWPEHDGSRARQALRNALHSLRRALGADVIRSGGDYLVGVDESRFVCDALDLEREIDSGGHARSLDGPVAEAFTGFHVSDAPRFGAWMDAERSRLAALQRLARTPSAVVSAPAEAPSRDWHGDRRRSPHDQDAYALYVRGNYMFLQAAHNGRLEDLDRSRECFERALAIDPQYALAIAGLSNYYAVAGARGIVAPFAAAFGRALELSHEAIALDPALAVPHVHFGVKALYLDHDLPAAQREFSTAIALDPKFAEGHRFLGITLSLLGQRERALTPLETAVRLEPDILIYKNSLAAELALAGDVKRAEVLFREALRIDPAHGPSRERLLRLLEQQQRFEHAVSERCRPPATSNADQFALAWKNAGAAGYHLERAAELRQLVATLEARLLEGGPANAADHFHPPMVRLAVAYSELGDMQKARAWKLQACAARPGLQAWFVAEPLLRALNGRT